MSGRPDIHWLCPYSSRVPVVRRAPTRQRQREAARYWPCAVHSCLGEDDYARALQASWTGILGVWEHDVVPTLNQLAALAACPEPVCVQAYPLYYPPTAEMPWWPWLADAAAWAAECGQGALAANLQARYALAGDAPHAQLPVPLGAAGRWPVCAHRIGVGPGMRWVRWGQAWAEWLGLGCAKFDTTRLPPLPARLPGWAILDEAISRWLQAHRVPIHVHWGGVAAHHHGCACHPDLPAKGGNADGDVSGSHPLDDPDRR